MGHRPGRDIVIVALLYNGVVPAVAQYADALAGKVIVDICNPFNSTFDGLAHREETSIAQEVAKVAPAGASVVKAFNTVFRHVLEKGRPDVFIAGDDAQAKARVEAFIESLGLRPLDVGGLKMAHWLEGAGVVTVGPRQPRGGELELRPQHHRTSRLSKRLTEPFRSGRRSGDGAGVRAGCTTHRAPVLLREVSIASTQQHGSPVGSLPGRTRPPAHPGRVGHDAHRHP